MRIPDQARLLHILEAIDYVDQSLLGKTKQDLYDNALLRFAVERQLEVIGEAANHLSDALNLSIQLLNGVRSHLSEFYRP